MRNGLIWGAFMFLVIGLGFPFIFDEELTSKHLIIHSLDWFISGLGYVYFTFQYAIRQSKK